MRPPLPRIENFRGAVVRSDEQYLEIERSLQRAWAKGAGLIDEEFERPMIAVVNTCQEFSPENIHLRQVGDAVKAGIRMAGGTPCEFNTFHVTDSETFASVGMRYVLPSRDLAASWIYWWFPRCWRSTGAGTRPCPPRSRVAIASTTRTPWRPPQKGR
ncbi:MAG: dihydroxy-acid dehydratase [Rhodospirillaceae bacterium]|nr:dihydroxy-acid dehydratase [Rhodospirillaceae bacterium]